jgi:transposase
MTLKRCFRSGLRSMDGTIEIITGKERRRRWSIEEKLRIVAESEAPGARVRDVAVRHEVYPSLLFNWRRQVREGRLGRDNGLSFMPVRLIGSSASQPALPARRAATDKANAAAIEIVLPDGTRLYIRREAQLPLLRPVIAALRG